MTDPNEPPPLARLRAAGFDLSTFDEEQLQVLAALEDDELTVLLDIRERLGDVRPEVEVHSVSPLTIGGLLF
jgi:hypothetical protein